MVNQKNEKNKNSHELHISLESDTFEKLDRIRNYHGIRNLTEVIRFLITKEHREIERSDLP